MPRLTVTARRELVEGRQKQILEAAAQVFAEKGFAAATIRDIARAAGLAEGSIYLYFKNKQDVLVHLPRQFIQPPLEAFRAQMRDGTSPPPDELLAFVARNIVNAVTHNTALMRALFNSMPTLDAESRATYMREGPAYAIETIETYIRAQQAAGIFRKDVNPQIAARAMPGIMLFFLLIQEIVQPADMPRFEYDEIIPTVVSLYLRGILTDPNSFTPQVTKPAHARPKKQPTPKKHRKQEIEIE